MKPPAPAEERFDRADNLARRPAVAACSASVERPELDDREAVAEKIDAYGRRPAEHVPVALDDDAAHTACAPACRGIGKALLMHPITELVQKPVPCCAGNFPALRQS